MGNEGVVTGMTAAWRLAFCAALFGADAGRLSLEMRGRALLTCCRCFSSFILLRWCMMLLNANKKGAFPTSEPY
jgi:hypothetical protein